MKNKIYFIGLLSLLFMVCGSIFKIMHWPGAGILLLLGYAMTLVFFPFAIRSSYVDGGKKNPTLFLAAFITLVVDFLGSLFKIMHWPGANWMLVFGITFPVIVFLPVYIYFQAKEKEKSLMNFMYVMFLLVFLGVMSALLAVNPQKEVITDVVRITYLTDNKDYLDLKKEILVKSAQKNRNSDVESVQQKTAILLHFVNDLKIDLIRVSNEDENMLGDEGTIDLWQVKMKDNYDIPRKILLASATENEMSKVAQLSERINMYKQYLMSLTNDVKLRNRLEQILKLEEHTIHGELHTWESFHFEQQALVFVFNTLDNLQNDIKLAETETLNFLREKETR